MAGPGMSCTPGGFSPPCTVAVCALEQVCHRVVKWPQLCSPLSTPFLGQSNPPEPAKWAFSRRWPFPQLPILMMAKGNTNNSSVPWVNQFCDWTVLYFCTYLLYCIVLWQWSCPMFNRYGCGPPWGGGVFSWSWLNDQEIILTMDQVDCCTPPQVFLALLLWF